MTQYHWQALDEMQQAEAVWSGTLLGDRQEELHTVLLYQIDGFYVEVYFNKEHGKRVRFRAFSTPDQLIPYLEYINIEELL